MFVNVAPPLVLTCHCTVGAGWPEAAALNVAAAPAVTVTLIGLVVITGAEAFGFELPAPHAPRTAQATTRAATVATVDRCAITDRPLRWAPAEGLPLRGMETRVAHAVERVMERKRAVMRGDMELLMCDAW
jgi:hypothetical protein